VIDRVTGRTAPGPRGLPLLGNLFPFRRDVLRLLVESRDRFGDLVRFRLGPNVVHLAAHPDLVRQVLQERADLYDKETRSSVRIREMTGLGLLTANGESWRRERRLIQPAFRPAAVAGFVERMTEAAAAMLERWERLAAEGRPLDVASEMMRLTYTIVGRTLFSADVASDADEVEHAMAVMLGHTYGRLERIVAPPSWLPIPGNLRFKRALAAVDRVVYRILSERRRTPTDSHDLLSLLLRERDEETGAGMSDPQLRNETITLLLAGHETTANALAWTFYLLAKHPEEMERLHAEVIKGTDEADFASLPCTERAFKEAMRLYPPIWAMERRAVAEDELGGFRIPAGSTVVVSPWVTHRHPDLWHEPERFDPGRFSEERTERRQPLAYIPFGAGPRFCVGGHFAMVEGVIILAMVLRRWRLRLVPGHPVVPKPGITLRARDGVQVTLERW
jgi:enediyne biosynthesis protein E7